MKKPIITDRIIIDRFEGKMAVVELPDRTIVNVPKIIFPDNVSEGDIIEIRIDRKETKTRETKIKELVDELWE